MATHTYNTPSGVNDPALPPIFSRRYLEDAIELMIDLLDEADGDADIEPDLAGTPNLGAACDAEDDSDDLEPDEGREPSLGWPESGDGPQRPSECNIDGGTDLEQCVSTGFRRARRDRYEQHIAGEAEARRIGAFIRRATGFDDAP